ncbi:MULTISPECIES: DUF1987 domain-containing protein [Symbiopectobacterium]|uniref:DUF1987 domain-containing protein n=1 Tax=Symbiopectobacterium TaxID=801 RepID=UPI001A213977|nr:MULTISPECIES: DUF1987 domain-containing protein [Symbiopectobacterium]MBG6247250.1 DUF1987 domain-containing protein [Candidatus Symbiopectobacterium sp. PLON1]MBT9428320.1 DUF1987 domain-containing protein [Candidatus Symbiopectobacterium endolongispinus]
MINITRIDNVHLSGAASTPSVDFCFDTHRLSLSGESYPENAAAFYRPLIEKVGAYLAELSHRDDAPATEIEAHISLSYFNSSSTKMLFSLLNVLHLAAQGSLAIALHWYHDCDDDIAQEFGEELHIDFPALDFHGHIME